MGARGMAAVGLVLGACLSAPPSGTDPGPGPGIDAGEVARVVLLVVPDESALVADNEAFRDRLEALGFSVVLRDDDDCVPSDSLDRSLVMFGRGSSTENVRYGCAMQDEATPLFVMSSNLWLHHMGGDDVSSSWADGTVFTIEEATAGHALAGGLSGGLDLFVDTEDDQHGTVAVTTDDAIVVARSGVDDNPSIFAYPAGATLPPDSAVTGDVAPARRVGFLGNYERHVGNWSDAAWTLFDAAVMWATGG